MSEALREWAAAHARSVGRQRGARPAAAEVGEVGEVSVGRPDMVLDRTPDLLRAVSALRMAVLPDGRLVAAVGVSPGQVDREFAERQVGGITSSRQGLRIFTLRQDGLLDRTPWIGPFLRPAFSYPVAHEWPVGWAVLSDTQVIVVSLDEHGRVRTRATYHLTTTDPRPFSRLHRHTVVRLVTTEDHSALLISTSADAIRVENLESGEAYSIPFGPLRCGPARAVAWSGELPDGTALLASSHPASPIGRHGAPETHINVWDGTGTHLHRLRLHPHHKWGGNDLAWAVLPDGRAVLACEHGNGGFCTWDGLTGTPLIATGENDRYNPITALAWAVVPGGPALLATGYRNGLVRVWDGLNGPLLFTFTDLMDPAELSFSCEVGWVHLPDGALWLHASGRTGTRIWEIPLTREPSAGPPPQPLPQPCPPVPPAVRTGLVALAAYGVCPPLGILADLVALTGPWAKTAAEPPLHDRRLRELASHPGVRALRELEWATPARVGLAGLLATGLPDGLALRPPGHGPRELSGALHQALAAESGTPRSTDASPAMSLSVAANAVTTRMTALLAALGPQAVADDPALPLRVAQHAPAMPAVDPRRIRLLTSAATHGARHAGTTVYAPGTAGVSRAGTPAHLLPSQLALPAQLFSIRHARRELLYRLHSAAPRWVPEAVTLVLDTTPPAFGPPEIVLRSLAHLLTTTLWEHGSHPEYIGLDEPRLRRTISRPVDLPMLWTSRTLQPPDLATALATAASTGLPTVVLAPHRLVSERLRMPGPRLRLATTHVRGDPPRGRPAHRRHVHLPPDATGSDLAVAVRLLLSGESPS